MLKSFVTEAAAITYMQTFSLRGYVAVPFLGCWALKHVHGMHWYEERDHDHER